MPAIPREVAEHPLDILPQSRVVQQWLRRSDEGQRRAIGVELRKLLEAGFIKEVFHPTWLPNPVLVKKKNGKWRMCVDYTSVNKACPKVPFPLPRIDQIVDSTSGCELLCFLDAYYRYHQIKMKKSDQLVTSFITPLGCSAMWRCRLASEMRALHTSDVCSMSSETTSGRPLRHT
jgi:hypothetical protein